MKKTTTLSFLFLLFIGNVFSQNNWEQFILLSGTSASKPMFMTEYNGDLYFQARGPLGTELYKTDGTQGGTVLVDDILETYTYGSYPENFTIFKNELYFTASHELYGRELFKTDGTTVTLVKDINPGISNSQTFREENQTAMIEHNGFLYFFANDSQSFFSDWDLWKTDGTEAGTTKVLEFNTDETFGFKKNFKLIDGKFYFMKKLSGYTYLYQFNPETEVLTELTNLFGDITHLTAYENRLFFTHNSFSKLYCTSGSDNTAINLVADIGSRQMKKIGSSLIFIGSDWDLHKCFLDTNTGNYITQLLYNFSGTNDPFYNQTQNGAEEVFYEYNNKLYFAARESTSPINQSGGEIIQIYATDGSSTSVAIPINNQEFDPYSGNFIKKIVAFNDKLYFMMYNFLDGYHLWSGDPSNGDYEQLNLPDANNTPKNIALEQESKSYNDIVVYNNSLYMGAFTTAEEKELWKFTGSSSLSLKENNTNNGITIYPNPSSNFITIQGDLDKFNIGIYSLLGNEIAKYNNQRIINVSNLASGVYLLKLVDLNTNQTIIKKVIKQ